MIRRGTVHRTVNVRGKTKSLTVERRPIEAKATECPATRQHEPVTAPAQFLGPLAVEIASALRQRPMRFPADWFRGGEA